MRMTRVRSTLIATLSVVATVCLAACSSTPDAGSPTSSAPAAAASAPTTDQQLHAELPQAIRDAGVIRFAGDSHPPYRTVGSDGSVTGIDKDFQDALGAVLGVSTSVEIVNSLP